MDEGLRKTPLAEEHQALGAKMVDFGGWFMPIQYKGLVHEHTAVRERVGLFDVSHMGEIRITGNDAVAFIDSLCTNDVTKLNDGQAHYTLLTTSTGTVIDDLLVYRIADDNLLLVVNAANQDKDFSWICEYIGDFDVAVANESEATGQLAIQGPLAEQVLQRLLPVDLTEIAYYHFAMTELGGIPVLVSRTGYTGEDGFEVYAPAEELVDLWRKILQAGTPEGIEPIGLGARDTLRLEARMHLYGNDMDDETTALEAGLGWATKLRKASDFTGKAALKAQKKEGLQRKLVGFELIGKGIARQGYPVMAGDDEIGKVTSGTHSPTLKKAIGLAYVPIHLSKPDSPIHIKIRNKIVEAIIVKGPFYKRP